MTAEHQRLAVNAAKKIPLEQWGPYLSERQWGTVREDYSPYGDAWHYFPYDHAHCRTYFWGEDGLGGISDFFQNLCFAVALWNGKDPILKERLFGLGNKEGNHGEDVKELYYYTDNLPTHYYMEYLYKYPQQEFPYKQLLEENRKRSREEPEYEILDTGVFDKDEYFDVKIAYAKQNARDIFIRIDLHNRYNKEAEITVLPTLWFYNRWQYDGLEKKPVITAREKNSVKATHSRLGPYYFYFQPPQYSMFTENETNFEKVSGGTNKTPFVKDAFHDAVIRKANVDALRQKKSGTKFAPVYQYTIAPGETKHIYLRLSNRILENPFGGDPARLFTSRKSEADAFYQAILPANISPEMAAVQRQALAGLLWSKQYYHFDVERWLTTSDGISPVNAGKLNGRNHDWKHLKNQDIIAMPDKWEYPWYAAWDLAFQSISMALVDPVFAKHQLMLIMREWYMKPDGQIPAYEWNFSDVNPPVQAWAALEVYRIEKERTGKGDIGFLKRIFQKLLINFTWWINRKDANGNNMFEGGFLGLDNIGVFNRSHPLGGDFQLEQADGTSWMGMYALNMMDMALEIAMRDDAFEDTATKFFEHFVLIAEALNEQGMWNDEDKFFYDTLSVGGSPVQLRIQSIVGLTTLFAVSIIEKKTLHKLGDFKKRINWFENYRLKNKRYWPNEEHSDGEQILLSLVPQKRLIYLLDRLLNEAEFLSPGGIRALSKFHEKQPYTINISGIDYHIKYDPGDSTSDFFGGNSNWRGPVWIPINYLIIRSIRRYGEFYGEGLTVDYPAGSGQQLTLEAVANRLTDRVIGLFEKDKTGKRLSHGKYNWFYQKPGNQDLLLFYEYFHGDDCHGLGASHQTGWTSLVAELISEAAGRKKEPAVARKEPAAAAAKDGAPTAARPEGTASKDVTAEPAAEGTPSKDATAASGADGTPSKEVAAASATEGTASKDATAASAAEDTPSKDATAASAAEDTPSKDFAAASAAGGPPSKEVTAVSAAEGTASKDATAASGADGTPSKEVTAASSAEDTPSKDLTAPSGADGTPSKEVTASSSAEDTPSKDFTVASSAEGTASKDLTAASGADGTASKPGAPPKDGSAPSGKLPKTGTNS